MAKKFNGKIALDIRDSEPDWAPYLAPKAPADAPNVLFVAWDDLGYATMDSFGGPVSCPNMARLAERGVKFANFHTTALCSPTRSSLLTGRNATSSAVSGNMVRVAADHGSSLARTQDEGPLGPCAEDEDAASGRHGSLRSRSRQKGAVSSEAGRREHANVA